MCSHCNYRAGQQQWCTLNFSRPRSVHQRWLMPPKPNARDQTRDPAREVPRNTEGTFRHEPPLEGPRSEHGHTGRTRRSGEKRRDFPGGSGLLRCFVLFTVYFFEPKVARVYTRFEPIVLFTAVFRGCKHAVVLFTCCRSWAALRQQNTVFTAGASGAVS